MKPNVVTAHARQRAYERLSFLEPDVIVELLETIKRQQPGRSIPRWADPWLRHEYVADGLVRIRVWEPCPRKNGWHRERTVGFPAVSRDDRYELTTCLLGPLTGHERLSSEMGSRIK